MSGAREQVARLLALVPYIQARREVSLEQAATDFAVSPAQIVKDLNVLWFCGLPGLGMGDLIDVDMEALEEGGVIRVSNADYLRRPLRLDSSEASALIVALRALREGSDDDVRPIVDSTLSKLEAAAGDGAALAAQVDVADVRLTRGERVEPGDAVHERGLAGARRAHDGREGAGGEVDGDAVQRRDGGAALAIDTAEVLRGDDGGHAQQPPSHAFSQGYGYPPLHP